MSKRNLRTAAVSRFRQLRSESLEVRFLLSVGVEAEPNDSTATATGLPPNDSVSIVAASIQASLDKDYFSFAGGAGDRIWSLVDTGIPNVLPAPITSRDSVLDLFDTDGTTLIETDDNDGTGNGGDEFIESTNASVIGGRELTSSGTHFLRVTQADTRTIDSYQLFLAVTKPADETAEAEANDTAATANSVIPGAAQIGVRTAALSSVADVDFYSFTAAAGDSIFIVADGNPERDGSNTGVEFELRDTDGTTVLISADSSSNSGGFNAEGLNFTVPAAGTYFVKVFDIDGEATGTYDLMVANAGPNALIIFGTEAKDGIALKPADFGIAVKVNKSTQVYFGDQFQRYAVFGRGGDDKITVDKTLEIDTLLDGGAGKDKIKGGAGNNILIGGPGKDGLTGGPLADVLIGGADADKLAGGKSKLPGDGNLLIGGPTIYDANDKALLAILKEWSSGDPYAERVDDLRDGTGVPAIDGTTVLADGAADSLKGGSDLDWYVVGSEDSFSLDTGETADVDGVPLATKFHVNTARARSKRSGR